MWKRAEKRGNMKNKVGIGNWILVLVISAVLIPSIMISILVLPVEMVALNPESYSAVFEEGQYALQMPPVIAEVVTDEVLLAGEVPLFLSRKQNFKSILAEYLPEEWVESVLIELTNKTLDYFNFNTPYSAVEIDINALKAAITRSSDMIAENYVSSLESCTEEQLEAARLGTTLNDFPACNPKGALAAELEGELSVFLGDQAARLPNSLNLIGLIPAGMKLGERTFYWYSILRWLFRLLPFITIILLIVAAYLLKANKKVMRGWIGWLLLGVSGLMLISALVILVGMEQFIGLIFNPSFSQLIAGFGNVLLSIVHVIGNRVLMWVIAQSGLMLLFGLILVLAAKYAKPQKQEIVEEAPSEEIRESVTEGEKAIAPQTLEEIEQEERENGEEKKAD